MAEPKLKRPDSFITAKDRYAIWITLFISLGFLFSIPNLDGSYINQIVLDNIPYPMRGLMLFFPFALYGGIFLHQQSRFNMKLKQEAVLKDKLEKQKSVCEVLFKEEANGTFWQIKNKNTFALTNAKFFIEREFLGKKSNERILIGTIEPGETKTLVSSLDGIESAKWRVMVLSKEGQYLDFPDRIKEKSMLQGGL